VARTQVWINKFRDSQTFDDGYEFYDTFTHATNNCLVSYKLYNMQMSSARFGTNQIFCLLNHMRCAAGFFVGGPPTFKK
jgi:hypothetical protein